MKQNFKTFKLLTAVAVTLFLSINFISCDKDGDEEISDAIKGKWTFESLTYEIEHPNAKMEEDQKETREVMMLFGKLLLEGSTFEFKSDKTYRFTVLSEILEGTYSISNGNLAITSVSESKDESSVIELDAGSVIGNNTTKIRVTKGKLVLEGDMLDDLYDEDPMNGDYYGKTKTNRDYGFTRYSSILALTRTR